MSTAGKTSPGREGSPKAPGKRTANPELGPFGQALQALNQPSEQRSEQSRSPDPQETAQARSPDNEREALRANLTNVQEEAPRSVGRRRYLPGASLSAVLVPGKRLNITKTGVMSKEKIAELESAIMNIELEEDLRVCDIITTTEDLRGFKTAFWIYLYLHASGEEGVADRGLIGYDGSLEYDGLIIQSEIIAAVLKPFQVIRYMRARADEISRSICLVRTDYLDLLATGQDRRALADARAMITEIDTRAAQYGIDPPQHAFPGSSHISTLSFSTRMKLEAANKSFLRERVSARMIGGMSIDDSQVGRQ